ncbi:MAG: sigma-70 family RNA polymerase sigma factor [Desulfitobacterium sp.]|nr:sigma-70 family RNA polymerase sigma factor [Desulfitobacterium sp.]
MELLPLLLFICGCICLYWAFKMGNPSGKSSPETLTILQGVAKVKKEVSQGQKSLREVQSQLGDHELRLYRMENVQEDLRGELANLKKESFLQMESDPSPQLTPSMNQRRDLQRMDFQRITPQREFINEGSHYMEEENLSTGQPLPEKYRKALELSQLGWSLAEIAGHLGVSQDAVSMVLRTAAVGKEPKR